MMMRFRVYTDGSCSGNPGKGGWAALIRSDEGIALDISGRKELTTNNEMELTAVLKALENIDSIIFNRYNKQCYIEIYSDSSFVVNSINQGWLHKWKENDWKTTKGQNIAHAKIWRMILFYISLNPNGITFHKVKAHSGIKLNEEADKLAKSRING